MTALRKALSSNLKTLVLNGDYRPISVTSVRRGLNLCLEEKAHIVESFAPPLDCLRSESMEIETPSVIVLSQYVRVKLSFSGNNNREPGQRVRLQLISERDNFTCQYCGASAQSVDHVIPKSKGGTGNWDNLVACCHVRAPQIAQCERGLLPPLLQPP